MIDATIAVKRTLGFEDPQWQDPEAGGLPGPDPAKSDPSAVERFGINSAFNKGLPPSFFDGTMPYADALSLAIATYQVDYWLGFFEDVATQDLANVLFDLQVNPGSGAGTRAVQQAANDLGQSLTVDGSFGTLSHEAVKACDPAKLLERIQIHRIAYYQSCDGWSDQATRESWTARTYAP